METCIRFADENAALSHADRRASQAAQALLRPMVIPRACVFITALKGRVSRNPLSVGRIKWTLILLRAPGMDGILPSELAAWPSCGKPDCTYGLQCIFKHGDGTEQVAAKHGRLSTSRTQHAAAPSAAPPAATSFVASAHTGGDLPASFTTAQLGALLTDLRTELRTSNRIYQQHASANAPTQLGPPGPLPSNNPWATWLQQYGRLTTSLLQVIEQRILSNAGQRAVSLFNSRGTHLGQALDSGGSD